jgi:hypothetical protein
VRCRFGGGTSAASLAMKASGSSSTDIEPSASAFFLLTGCFL